MTIYFEVVESYSIVNPGIYSLANHRSPPGPYLTASQRAWEEIDGTVYYVKHPDYPVAVNLKEFSWVKLQARSL